MRKVFITWDTTNEDDDDNTLTPTLPKEVDVPDAIPPDEIADYLSDTYGFCVLGLTIY